MSTMAGWAAVVFCAVLGGNRLRQDNPSKDSEDRHCNSNSSQNCINSGFCLVGDVHSKLNYNRILKAWQLQPFTTCISLLALCQFLHVIINENNFHPVVFYDAIV